MVEELKYIKKIQVFGVEDEPTGLDSQLEDEGEEEKDDEDEDEEEDKKEDEEANDWQS